MNLDRDDIETLVEFFELLAEIDQREDADV